MQTKSKNCHIRGKLCVSRSFKICSHSHSWARGFLGSLRNRFPVPSNWTAVNGFGKSRWYISINTSKIYVDCTDNGGPWKALISLHGEHTSVSHAPTLPPTSWCQWLVNLGLLWPQKAPCSLVRFSVDELCPDSAAFPPPPRPQLAFHTSRRGFPCRTGTFACCEDRWQIAFETTSFCITSRWCPLFCELNLFSY